MIIQSPYYRSQIGAHEKTLGFLESLANTLTRISNFYDILNIYYLYWLYFIYIVNLTFNGEIYNIQYNTIIMPILPY